METRPSKVSTTRVVILIAIVVVLLLQGAWIASLNELYGLLSGSVVGLSERDVRNLIGEPVSVVRQGAVQPIPAYQPEPSAGAPTGGKILVYKRFRYVAYVYISSDERVESSFVAHRF